MSIPILEGTQLYEHGKLKGPLTLTEGERAGPFIICEAATGPLHAVDPSIEESSSVYESENGKSCKHLLTLEGRFQMADTENRNGRVYPESLWEKVFNDRDLLKSIDQGEMLGECDHPTDGETRLSRVAGMVTKIWRNPENLKEVLGRFAIYDNDKGRQLKSIHDGGGRLGVSSRGTGSVVRLGGKDVVQEDFKLKTWDSVHGPSTAGAYPEEVTESTETFARQGNQESDMSKRLEELASRLNKLQGRDLSGLSADAVGIIKETATEIQESLTTENFGEKAPKASKLVMESTQFIGKLDELYTIGALKQETAHDSKFFATDIMTYDQSASQYMHDGALRDIEIALRKEGKGKEADQIAKSWDGNVKKLQKLIKSMGLTESKTTVVEQRPEVNEKLEVAAGELDPGDKIYVNGKEKEVRSAKTSGGKVKIVFTDGKSKFYSIGDAVRPVYKEGEFDEGESTQRPDNSQDVVESITGFDLLPVADIQEALKSIRNTYREGFEIEGKLEAHEIRGINESAKAMVQEADRLDESCPLLIARIGQTLNESDEPLVIEARSEGHLRKQITEATKNVEGSVYVEIDRSAAVRADYTEKFNGLLEAQTLKAKGAIEAMADNQGDLTELSAKLAGAKRLCEAYAARCKALKINNTALLAENRAACTILDEMPNEFATERLRGAVAGVAASNPHSPGITESLARVDDFAGAIRVAQDLSERELPTVNREPTHEDNVQEALKADKTKRQELTEAAKRDKEAPVNVERKREIALTERVLDEMARRGNTRQ